MGMGKNQGVTAGLSKEGQLVVLECPRPFAGYPVTETALENDGTLFDPLDPWHLPWMEHVLINGPDVMFCVADKDPRDNCIEVLSSQFFGKSVVVHSIQRGCADMHGTEINTSRLECGFVIYLW